MDSIFVDEEDTFFSILKRAKSAAKGDYISKDPVSSIA